MSSCCARHGQEELFSERLARRDAQRYRRKGPDALTRAVARRAAARGIEGRTVLDVGGGVGQVLLELLRAGADRGEVVELVPAYEEEANALAAEAGVADRARFRTADLVTSSEGVDAADVVVLNRVVCCTPDGVELAGIAAGLARRTLVLSHPRGVWWARLVFAGFNLGLRLLRRSFRVFVHPRHAIDGAVVGQGLSLHSAKDGPLFRIAAYERP